MLSLRKPREAPEDGYKSHVKGKDKVGSENGRKERKLGLLSWLERKRGERKGNSLASLSV